MYFAYIYRNISQKINMCNLILKINKFYNIAT